MMSAREVDIHPVQGSDCSSSDGIGISPQLNQMLGRCSAHCGRFVNECIAKRLHSGIDYITPQDRLERREQIIQAEPPDEAG